MTVAPTTRSQRKTPMEITKRQNSYSNALPSYRGVYYGPDPQLR
jgi:hypothetical protein